MRKILLTTLFAAVLFSAWPKDAWAVFQLSVSPRRGGQSVRFESAQPGGMLRNEEVTVTVTTDRAAQYRILQTVYQPLTNEMGNTMPAGALVMFSPSKPLGNLRSQLETPVSLGQSQIYTSNNSGDSDEFVLVYNVRVPENQPGGIYRTQLTFTAEPVNMQAGISPSTTTLEIRVEINPKFHIEIINQRSARGLDLGRIEKDRVSAQQSMAIQITSNIGSPYRLFQQMTEPFSSTEGGSLDDAAFTFTPSGNIEGSFSSGARSAVPVSQTLLYTSGEWGGSDRLQLDYVLTPDTSEKAGSYRGNLSFRVESNSPFASQEVINVPVEVEIEPIFNLDVAFSQGRSLNFGAFKTGDEKQERQAVLKVHSNLGQPYQITQVVPRKMMTEEGTPLADGNFQFFTQNVRFGTASASPSPVEAGEKVIYSSDSKGTPEEFLVNYTLTIPRNSRAGSYTSEVKYSITTL